MWRLRPRASSGPRWWRGMNYFWPAYLRMLPGAYAPSTLGPGPDYPVAMTGQAHERGESQCGDEGGEGLGKLINNNNFSDLRTSDLGRISNLSLSVSRMNNLIPNVTTTSLNPNLS